MADVRGPMHSVDFGQVTAKISARTHDDARKRFDFSCYRTDCKSMRWVTQNAIVSPNCERSCGVSVNTNEWHPQDLPSVL